MYEIVKEPEQANVAFRRVGCYAGKFIESGIVELFPQSHIFIKIYDKTDKLMERLNGIIWKTDNTIGRKVFQNRNW